jgi:lipoprotein-anchoring transpeptidase ErfK/SrfK
MALCLLSEIALAIAEGAEMNRVARWAENTASKHFLAVLALAAAIPCWAQNPGPADGGQQSRVVLVSLVDRKLAVIENGGVIATFQVAVGAKVSPSPTGEFTIVSRVTNPTYYHRGTVIPAGKDSPVGTRWVGLTLKGYGIHGTNAPGSIGRAASHGCIRLRNRDVERLFTMLRIGDRVQIRGERDEEVARVFGGQTDQTVVASAQDPSQSEQQEATQSAVGLGN